MTRVSSDFKAFSGTVMIVDLIIASGLLFNKDPNKGVLFILLILNIGVLVAWSYKTRPRKSRGDP